MRAKLQTIYELSPNGDTSTKTMYYNCYTPRYNLQSFIMQKVFKCCNFWDKRNREKADNLIKEGDFFLMFEDSAGYIYTIRKKPF